MWPMILGRTVFVVVILIVVDIVFVVLIIGVKLRLGSVQVLYKHVLPNSGPLP